MRASQSRQTSDPRRSGAAALWTLIVVPALVGSLLFIADAGRVWSARIELRNALEAAALAGARAYAETYNATSGNRPASIAAAELAATEFAAANRAGGVSVTLVSGDIVTGSLTGQVFNPAGEPVCGDDFGVQVSKGPVTFHEFPSLFNSFLGQGFGSYRVRGRAYARSRCNTSDAELVFVQ